MTETKKQKGVRHRTYIDDELAKLPFNVLFSDYSCVSDIPEFRLFASRLQWKDRRKHGIPWRKDVFEFIQERYGDWIEEAEKHGLPLTQADIKVVDKPLYSQFQRESSLRGGRPKNLKLPSLPEAALNSIEDPEERKAAELIRAYERGRKSRQREQRRTQRNPSPT